MTINMSTIKPTTAVRDECKHRSTYFCFIWVSLADAFPTRSSHLICLLSIYCAIINLHTLHSLSAEASRYTRAYWPEAAKYVHVDSSQQDMPDLSLPLPMWHFRLVSQSLYFSLSLFLLSLLRLISFLHDDLKYRPCTFLHAYSQRPSQTRHTSV